MRRKETVFLYIVGSESEKMWFQYLAFKTLTMGERIDAREVQQMDTDIDTLIR